MIIEQKIGTLVRVSNTQVQLAGLSIVKLGGQFKSLTSPTLLTSVSGIGGIDTGAIAASSFYYVYAVSTGSVEGLVASLSAASPVGFLRFKKVGVFYTDSGSLIFKAYYNGEINEISLSAHVADGAVTTTVTEQTPYNFINGNFTNPSAGNYIGTFNSDAFASIPHCWIQPTNRRNSSCQTVSTTTVNITVANDAGVVLDSGFTFYAKKTGIDAIQPDWKDY